MDDYDVIVQGTAKLLEPYGDRVIVVEMEADGVIRKPVDVALLDCFGQAEAHRNPIERWVVDPHVHRLAVYTWNFAQTLVTAARERGACGYLGKGLTGDELADAIVDVHRGGWIVRQHAQAARAASSPRRWPGKELGLTERESEVLVYLTQGKRPREIAELLYLSPNSVKTHTRNLYRKLGVSGMTEAALWGVDHGFRPDRPVHEYFPPCEAHGPSTDPPRSSGVP